jgi:hypothetical protein
VSPGPGTAPPRPHGGRMLLSDPSKAAPGVHRALGAEQVGELGAVVSVHGGCQRFTPPSPPLWPAIEHPRLDGCDPVLARFAQLRRSGLSAAMAGMDFFCQCLAPLQVRLRPAWFNTSDDDRVPPRAWRRVQPLQGSRGILDRSSHGGEGCDGGLAP